jgi:hypothetical protein
MSWMDVGDVGVVERGYGMAKWRDGEMVREREERREKRERKRERGRREVNGIIYAGGVESL